MTFFDYNFYGFNVMLTYDLLRTVRNPFESIEVRSKRMYYFVPMFYLLFFPYWVLYVATGASVLGEDNPSCGDYSWIMMSRPFEAALQCFYFCFALIVCFFATIILLRKGMNEEMRKITFRRLIMY